MDERTQGIIDELESRLARLPSWQKKATLETIHILENGNPTNEDMYINLRTAGHFDLADYYKRKIKK